MASAADRSRETRRKLLDAARVLFTERGYHETRPLDIARKARVGSGTFYLHFADKCACFLAFVDEAAQDVQKVVDERTVGAKNLQELVIGVLESAQAYSASNPSVLTVAAMDISLIDGNGSDKVPTLLDRWAADWAARIAEFQVSGTFTKDLEPLVVGHMIVGLLHQCSLGAMRGYHTRQQILNNVIPFLARATAPARE